ncbi:MAG: glutamate-5-semialdehyde dehydrogenase [Phycisphaeraceae bacterium]
MSTATLNIADYCRELADRAVAASRALVTTSGAQRTAALHGIARRLLDQAGAIKDANAQDLAAGRDAGLSPAMLDRLRLDDKGIARIADSVKQIAEQVDPVGQVIEGYTRPNGLVIRKVRVPIGVVLIIFESRPNVTSDAAALCIKSGNAAILRGGKEAIHSNAALARCVRQGLAEAGLDENAVQLVETTDRAAVGALLKMEGKIDLAIPRGGESLIRAVVEQARIPVIKHYTGNCHVYVAGECDGQMALDICVNAKTQRPGVCNACETIIFHASHVGDGLLAKTCQALAQRGVEIRGDQATRKAFPAAKAATEEDWGTEYLDLIVAVRVVDCMTDAIEHINKYGSKHTDAIVTSSLSAANMFVQQVDSANVMVNASTRFSDGGEYGLGAEIGISTDKLHARGPMGAADLTTYKWVVTGVGQVRG